MSFNERIMVAIDPCPSLLLIRRMRVDNDIPEASTQGFSLATQQCPKFSPKLHEITFFFGQKFIPFAKEVPITVVQVTNNCIEILAKCTGLAIAILGELVIDETRSLGIASNTLTSFFQHRWKLLPLTNIAREVIAHLDHLEQFMSDRTDTECFRQLKVVEKPKCNIDICNNF